MRVDFGFFCEDAELAGNNQIRTVTGIMNTISTSTFPSVYPKLVYVLGLKAHDADMGKRNITLTLVDPEGRPLAPSMAFAVQFSQDVMYFHTLCQIEEVTFRGPGLYQMEVAVNGRLLRSDDLHVDRRIAAMR